MCLTELFPRGCPVQWQSRQCTFTEVLLATVGCFTQGEVVQATVLPVMTRYCCHWQNTQRNTFCLLGFSFNFWCCALLAGTCLFDLMGIYHRWAVLLCCLYATYFIISSLRILKSKTFYAFLSLAICGAALEQSFQWKRMCEVLVCAQMVGCLSRVQFFLLFVVCVEAVLLMQTECNYFKF